MTATDMTAVAPADAPAARHEFRTDAEFAVLCPMRTREEYTLLEASILAHGVREPLVVWKEEKVLLDGHGRLAICNEHKVPFGVVEYSFADRAAARAWAIDNQLGRRNLSEEQRRYLRGKRLFSEKKSHGGRRESTPQSEALTDSHATAASIAEREGVSRATVERDAEYARAIDKISETCPKARGAILTGKLKLTREEVSRAAAAAPRSLAQVKRAGSSRPQSLAQFRRAVGRAKSPPPTVGSESKERLLREIDDLGTGLVTVIRLYKDSGFPPEELPRLRGIDAARCAIEALHAASSAEGARP